MTLSRGFLVALEGIDGSGKSTLAHALLIFCQTKLLPIILTREPGGTPLGKQLKTILNNPDLPLCAQAEYLLFAADRAQHMQSIVEPNLLQHKLEDVFCDGLYRIWPSA